MHRSHGKSSIGLRIIAIGKLLKVLSLVGFGIAAVALASAGDPPEAFRHWVDALQINEGHKIVHVAIAKLSGAEPAKLDELAVGCFVYAVLFAIEGTGLWLEKHWAEWLTIGITISFLPLEIYEIAKEATAPRIVTLVVNVAVVIYLGFRVRWERKPNVRMKRAVGM